MAHPSAIAAAAHHRRLAGLAVGLVAVVLVPALAATQGGFHPDTWVWAGTLAAWAAALALAVGGSSGALRQNRAWVAAGVALLLWTLASSLWSAERAQSLLEARRLVVYVAVTLALVVLARRGAGRTVVLGAYIGICAVFLYALPRYLLGPRHVHQFEGYLLSEPLGYANAVGVLAAMGILLSLWPATSRSARGRAAGAAALPPLALALELSGSSASLLALAAGLAVFVLLHPRPVTIVRPLVAALVPTALVVGIGHASRLSDPAQIRLHGWIVFLATVACAVIAATAAARLGPTTGEGRSVSRRALVLATLAVALVGAAVVVRAGADQPRASYYRIAWREYSGHPLLGSGAGTFGRYWALSGLEVRWGGALDAHSLYLETLAEVGPVGLLLLLAFLLAPLRRAGTRRELPWIPAAAGAAVVFLVHAGLDWDWELPAVVVAGLACAAGVALSDDERPEPLPPLQRAVALAAALLLGAAAIAGARSSTEPSAAEKAGAPRCGAPVV